MVVNIGNIALSDGPSVGTELEHDHGNTEENSTSVVKKYLKFEKLGDMVLKYSTGGSAVPSIHKNSSRRSSI